MSVARHHAEWLSLVEASGPFLSMSVLEEAFPQGLDAAEVDHKRRLRAAHEEWLANNEARFFDRSLHLEWISLVLRETLEFSSETIQEGQAIAENLRASFPEFGETIRPHLVVCEPDSRKPRLLVMVVDPTQHLEKPLAGSHWKTSPATRMMELLHASDVRLGLLTNGEHWMLVNAPRNETTGFISWYATLWFEEPLTLQAFRSLLRARRFFGVAEKYTIENLLAESVKNQQDVTEQLGTQVRKAVEMLVQTLDRLDKDRNRTLLAEVSEKQLYEAALTVMMRLVFLFSAEERGLLLLGDEMYDQYYAVSTLSTQLRETADQHGEEILETRADAWARLLATFRAVHGGLHHDALTLPAYGGTLFDPNRFPFLEGRPQRSDWRTVPAQPIKVDNRTVLHLLEALQYLRTKVGSGPAERRRLSFRALDIEQIGHVYEGLLDHSAFRATEPILGLIGKESAEPEVSLAELERLHAKGQGELVRFLTKETKASEARIQKLLETGTEKIQTDAQALRKLRTACDNDETLLQRVLPFAGVVRRDAVDYPVVISAGSIYVTKGTDRRASGTHYTPRSLTEEIVRYTLEPLVYIGPAEGLLRAEWKLKPAKEILALKVCDFAMGSGAFLVQTCRYLAERLVESWESAEAAHPGQVVSAPDGTLSEAESSESLIPKDSDERLTIARRYIADSCLYGVDVNPMAVEMAKLSLWLVTLQKNRPFTFLDHALRCGDSLLGVTSLKQIEYLSLHPEEAGQMLLVAADFKRWIGDALAKRQELESIPDNDITDVETKTRLFAEAEAALENIRFIADLLVGESLRNIGRPRADMAAELMNLSDDISHALDLADAERDLRVTALRQKAERILKGRRLFHWALEFPEVFAVERGGFDGLVGNPPFIGGSKITGLLGTDYREFLVENLANGKRGNADLCAFFFLRAQLLLKKSGNFGLIATNTIAQGDTREVGLDQITESNMQVYRAISSKKWPGDANLEIAFIWSIKGAWKGIYFLNELLVRTISSFLTEPKGIFQKPFRLISNIDKSFKGSDVLGMGFVLSPQEAKLLIEINSKNREVLFPFLNGEDLNSNYDQNPSRWIINYFDWSIEKAQTFPDCWKIIEERVKPERQRKNEIGDYVLRNPLPQRYWQYNDRRPSLQRAISSLDRVLVGVLHTKFWSISFCSTKIVFSHALVIFSLPSYTNFTILSSNQHEIWTREFASSMKGDLRYTPSDCFETFPFPPSTEGLDDIGERYYTHRQAIMTERQEGLTKTYNRFHNPQEFAPDIAELRRLHVEMDGAVARAYGWDDLELGHGFHQTKQGMRYTISETARREVLDRLLQLNHERYAQEVAQGLHDKGKPKKKAAPVAQTRKKADNMTPSLFD